MPRFQSSLIKGLLATMLLLAWCSSLGQTPTPPEPSWKITSRHAKAALYGDPDRVAILVQDVLDSNEATKYLSALTPDLKTRLVDAEVRYRTSGKGGFTDAKVAHAVNMLAKKVGAPNFAYTDRWQTRQLRMKMMTMLPALFGTNLRVAKNKPKQQIREEMSPIEAVCLLTTMVEQKFYNPIYQLSPAERVARWAALHRPQTTDFGAPNDRTTQMFDTLGKAGQNLGLRELAAFGTSVLSSFGSTQEGR